MLNQFFRTRLPARLPESFTPSCCIVCKRLCAKEPALCEGCLAILPWLNPSVCLQCGAVAGGHCLRCENRAEPLKHRLAVFEYAFPVDALLKKFKYKEKRAIGRCMGQILGHAALASGLSHEVDYLLPVPIALPRLKSRGFNQAADIAEACSEIVKVPWTNHWLHRQADTPMLAGLTPAERRFALLGAFAATNDVAGKHIVLIDDVMTSGATTLELNRELIDRGAMAVSVWTVARTVEPTKRFSH